MILISEALRLAHVNEGSQVLPTTHTFIHIWKEPSCIVISVMQPLARCQTFYS